MASDSPADTDAVLQSCCLSIVFVTQLKLICHAQRKLHQGYSDLSKSFKSHQRSSWVKVERNLFYGADEGIGLTMRVHFTAGCLTMLFSLQGAEEKFIQDTRTGLLGGCQRSG